jgi:hypothetical protein
VNGSKSTPQGELEGDFGEAQGEVFLAFGLKSAPGGRSSNLYQGNTYPRTHHSSIPLFQYSSWIGSRGLRDSYGKRTTLMAFFCSAKSQAWLISDNLNVWLMSGFTLILPREYKSNASK